jgi:MFS transporter, DHA1 family, inner membrane transport protein
LDKMALIMAAIAIGPLVGSYLGGYLSDRWRRVALCSGAAGLVGVLALALVLWPNLLPVSLVLAALYGGAYMATRAPLFSMVTATSDTHRGTLMGMTSLSNQVGWAAGSALGGAMLAAGGYALVGLLVLVASSAAALGYVIFVRDPHHRPTLAEPAS